GFADQPTTAHRRAPPSKTTPPLGRGPHPSAPADRPASGSNSPEIGRNMGRESILRPTGGSTWRRTTLDGASRPHEKDTVLRPKTRSRQKPDGKAVFLVKPARTTVRVARPPNRADRPGRARSTEAWTTH